MKDLPLANLDTRFDGAEGADGLGRWRVFVRTVRDLASAAGPEEGHAALVQELDRFVQVLPGRAAPPRQTLFVSHKSGNAVWAERVAWDAVQAGLDCWQDVHDPLLQAATNAPIPRVVRGVLIAGIIEIALLNSTHLVALPTRKSQKFRPYEFRRTKQRLVFDGHTASWFETGITPDPDGDYLSLTICATTKNHVRQWLTKVKRTPPQYPPQRPKWGTAPDLPN